MGFADIIYFDLFLNLLEIRNIEMMDCPPDPELNNFRESAGPARMPDDQPNGCGW
jgi:hypothetical protein